MTTSKVLVFFQILEQVFYYMIYLRICRRQSGAAGVYAASPVPPLRPLSFGSRSRSDARPPRAGPLPSDCPTEAPGPSPRKSRFRTTAHRLPVDFLGTVARAARLSGASVAVYRATNGPGKGTCRGGSVRSTRAVQIVIFLAEYTPERR